MVKLARRINKLSRIVFSNHETPPFLIFFVTSKCNLKCKHCFYWKNMGDSTSDLTFNEIENISEQLGKLYNLLLSGGEPFLRKDIVEICEVFYRNNQVGKLSIPTNGFLPGDIYNGVKEILSNCPKQSLDIQLSIDGLKDYHDNLRGRKGSFDRVLETYKLLSGLKNKFKNLSINTTSIIVNDNVDELHRLQKFIKTNMKHIDNIYFGLLRGQPRESHFSLPVVSKLREIKELINNTNTNRLNILLNNILFNLQIDTLTGNKQVIDCIAGNLMGVIDSNGDVRLCELLEPVGNVRQMQFSQIWRSQAADTQRDYIRKSCFCTHECFIVPSILYNPKNYLKAVKYIWNHDVAS